MVGTSLPSPYPRRHSVMAGLLNCLCRDAGRLETAGSQPGRLRLHVSEERSDPVRLAPAAAQLQLPLPAGGTKLLRRQPPRGRGGLSPPPPSSPFIDPLTCPYPSRPCPDHVQIFLWRAVDCQMACSDYGLDETGLEDSGSIELCIVNFVL